MKRPLIAAGIVFVSAMAAALVAGQSISFALALVFLGVFAAGMIAFSVKGKSLLPMALALLVSYAFLQSFFFWKNQNSLARYDGAVTTIQGRITEIRDNASSQTVFIDTTSIGIDGVPQRQRLIVYWRETISYDKLFSSISATVTFSLKDNNLSVFDRGYYLSKGVAAYAVASDFTFVSMSGNTPMFLISQLSSSFSNHIARAVGGAEGTIASKLLFGFGAIDNSLRASFTKSGLTYMLAVSGMNLSIAVGILSAALAAFIKQKRRRGVIGILFVLFYAAMAGFSVPIMRAAVMNIFILAAPLFYRENDRLNSLGGAVLVVFLINPLSVLDIGFWFSFGCTFGIIVFTKPIAGGLNRFFRRLPSHPYAEAAVETLAVSFAASIPLVVISVLSGTEISFISPVTTMLITPTLPFIMVFSLLAGVFAALFPYLPIGYWFGIVPRLLLKIVQGIADLGASLNLAAAPGDLALRACILFCAALMGFAFFKAKRYLKLSLALSVISFCFVLLMSQVLSANVTKLTAFPLSNGQAVILSQNRQNILFLPKLKISDRVPLQKALTQNNAFDFSFIYAQADDYALYSVLAYLKDDIDTSALVIPSKENSYLLSQGEAPFPVIPRDEYGKADIFGGDKLTFQDSGVLIGTGQNSGWIGFGKYDIMQKGWNFGIFADKSVICGVTLNPGQNFYFTMRDGKYKFVQGLA